MRWLWAPLAAGLLGLWARSRYVLRDHHPRHGVVSDAADMMATVARLTDAAAPQAPSDTIWPPGTPAVMAALRAADATLGLAAWAQLLLGCSLPLLVAHTTWLVAGRRAAWVALALASLHFGYVHYLGFFLSEAPFQLTCTLALWMTVLALRMSERNDSAPRGLLLGAAVGAGWAAAALFRPNAPPVAFFIAAGVAGYSLWARSSRRLPWLFAGAGLVGALLLAPAADRCSSIQGRTCLVSANFAMNVALGQAGPVSTVRFEDPVTGRATAWSPPSLWQHRYSGTETVPAEIYDTTGVLRWVAARFAADPWQALVRATGNALDLFRVDYWPSSFGRWSKRQATVAAQLFTLGAIFPGLLGAARGLRAARRRRAPVCLVALLAGMAGVLVLAFLSQGEPRYRFPFDVMWIALAAAVWAKADLSDEDVGGELSNGLAGAALGVGTAVALSVVVFVSLVAHPAVALGERFGVDRRVAVSHVRRIPADAVSAPRGDGHPWNEGTVPIACDPGCPELRLRWPTVQRAAGIEISLDHNDRYRITFYRAGRQLGFRELALRHHGVGLRVHAVPVPEGCDAFDEIGVLPLYGDGRYALGHVRMRSQP